MRAIATVPRWLVRPLRLSSGIDGPGRLLLHVGGHAAALDHEVLDDAMEDRAVVVAGLDVFEEVGDALRRLRRVELDDDVAGRRRQPDFLGERGTAGAKRQRGSAGDEEARDERLHRGLRSLMVSGRGQ